MDTNYENVVGGCFKQPSSPAPHAFKNPAIYIHVYSSSLLRKIIYCAKIVFEARLTLTVEADAVVTLSRWFLSDEAVHVLRSVLVKGECVRQRLAQRLQRERVIRVTHRETKNKNNPLKLRTYD